MGYAIEKHGLAHRFALGFLSLKGIGGKTSRLMFTYMLIVGVISMFVSDAATIAMTIPIGMSLVRHTWTMAGARPAENTNFAAFVTLGHLLCVRCRRHCDHHGRSAQRHISGAARAVHRKTARVFRVDGGRRARVRCAARGVLRDVVDRSCGQRFCDIPSGEAFLRAEQAKLGPLRSNERRVLLGVCGHGAAVHAADAGSARAWRAAGDFSMGNPGASHMGGAARGHVSVVRDSIIGGRRLALCCPGRTRNNTDRGARCFWSAGRSR